MHFIDAVNYTKHMKKIRQIAGLTGSSTIDTESIPMRKTAIAEAVAVADNQQTFNLDLNAIHACPIQIQKIIGSKVKMMLEAHVRAKYLNEAMGDGNTFDDFARTGEEVDANEFRRWLWVYTEMTDTMKHYTGRPMNLGSYLKYKATKIVDDIAVAQRKRHFNTVAELKKEYRLEMENAKDLMSEAEAIEMDKVYPVGFYEALTECLNERLEEMEKLSKPYKDMDTDRQLIKDLLTEL